MKAWFQGAWAVLQKDFRLEMRTRYAVNLLLMFVITCLLVVSLAVARDAVTPAMQSGLLWIVVLFSAAIGLGRAFLAEEEAGTVLLLRLNVRGSQVYAGKLLYNYLLLLAVDVVAVVGFALLLNLDLESGLLLSLVLTIGSLGLAATTTLLSAIIARASNRGPLLPVLAFPILFPLLLTVVPAARASLAGGGGWDMAMGDLRVIVAFAGTVITGAVLLFDYVWED